MPLFLDTIKLKKFHSHPHILTDDWTDQFNANFILFDIDSR